MDRSSTTAESIWKRSSWLARLWVASALLLIAGGAASVVYQLAVRLLHPSPGYGEISQRRIGSKAGVWRPRG